MRHRLFLVLLAFAVLAALAPGSALAAQKKPAPTVTKVSPMRLAVGGTVTIRGRNFSARRTRNTIIFRAPSGRTAFAKPTRASRTKLVLKVPSAVARLLSLQSGRPQPTRFKLRVLAGRFGGYTVKRLSPVVVPAGFSGPGGLGGSSASCGSGGDWDGDLLSNAAERDDLGTDPCLSDTDKDGTSDGWEYYSARDLNQRAAPYPGSRPYPNPLDPSDRTVDFDGDGLLGAEEYRAWRVTGSSFNLSAAGSDSVLGYSAGTQASRAGETPSTPGWRSPSYGLPAPSQPFPAIYDTDGDSRYTDDERDADGDGLANFLESSRGPGRTSWWKAMWAAAAVEAWPKTYYGDFSAQRPFAELDLADGDNDGDSLLDGEDDEDADGWTNIVEMYEAVMDVDGNGSELSVNRGGTDYFVNGFNPCAPDTDSRTCSRYTPF